MILTALLMAGAGLHAQEILTRFSTDRISCKYSYTIDIPITLNFEGEALVQGECYHLNGNGIDSLDLHAYLHAALILPGPGDPR